MGVLGKVKKTFSQTIRGTFIFPTRHQNFTEDCAHFIEHNNQKVPNTVVRSRISGAVNNELCSMIYWSGNPILCMPFEK